MVKPRLELMLCTGSVCQTLGVASLQEALAQEIEHQGLAEEVKIIEAGCTGFCGVAPVMLVQPEGVFYQKLTPKDVPRLVEEHFLKGRPVKKLLYKEPASEEVIPKLDDIPFFSHQLYWVMRNKGVIDPEVIEDYIARDGYFGAAKALTDMSPEEVVAEVKTSGLRGRGGAGFPTGLKWEFASKSPGDVKYVLCNADEGDPGAFMDRTILESDPHAVVEGMIIAGRAINAHQGYIYARTEYPLAIKRLEIAIRQAREYGLLGENILESGFDFDIDIYQGAGAFVCGEETALMRSIEGKRGMPRPRPPFPAHKGLWEKPTILNNVETLANVSQIILNGGRWYAGVGTETSKGTKVFALSGAVNNIGLVEVPMGTSLRTMIYDIGGGIPKKRKFKAVQLGGPGSGGAIVMDERTCMVDMARFFMDFVQDESCGKCTPCREGTRRLLQILERICDGLGKPDDIQTLQALSDVIKSASLCGLGQTGPNPVLSTLRYFLDEYQAHILEQKCPAKRCIALLKFEVDPEACTACGLCFKNCPEEAIAWEKKQPAVINRDKCTKCMTCFDKCRFDAIF
jgi:NADH-quinone oxidoreductase subunit F/NAD(P)H dehydrogenase (quinone)/NADP-reducing hydrogenase subunit HndC